MSGRPRKLIEISSFRHGTDFIDKILARRKLKRRIALRAPFLSAARILAVSEMMAVIPKRVAEELVRYRPLVIRALSAFIADHRDDDDLAATARQSTRSPLVAGNDHPNDQRLFRPLNLNSAPKRIARIRSVAQQ